MQGFSQDLVRQVQCVITLSNEESPKDMADFLECAGVALSGGLSLTDEHRHEMTSTTNKMGWVGPKRRDNIYIYYYI